MSQIPVERRGKYHYFAASSGGEVMHSAGAHECRSSVERDQESKRGTGREYKQCLLHRALSMHANEAILKYLEVLWLEPPW